MNPFPPYPGQGRVFLYNIAWMTAGLVGWPVAAALFLGSRRHRDTMIHRFFPARNPRNRSGPGKSVWVHALSVGEVRSAVSLIEGLSRRSPPPALAFSASTRTGFDTAGKLVGRHAEDLFHFPVDFLLSVRRALDRAAPDLIVLVETDLWPNFLWETARRKVPVFLVNARLSDRSFHGYKRAQAITGPLFSLFSGVCVQTRKDGDRFRALGVPAKRIFRTGNLKFDNPVPEVSKAQGDRWRERLRIPASARVFVAGSTHAGEESDIAGAFRSHPAKEARLVLIVIPRDPSRAPVVAQLFRSSGFSAETLSRLDDPSLSRPVQVIIGDRIGVLPELYALGDAAFVGGSLVPGGGHNPLEPAAYGKPVLFGPDMSDFSDPAELLTAAGAARQVSCSRELAEQAVAILKTSQRRSRMGRKAMEVVRKNRGAVNRTLAALAPFL